MTPKSHLLTVHAQCMLRNPLLIFLPSWLAYAWRDIHVSLLAGTQCNSIHSFRIMSRAGY